MVQINTRLVLDLVQTNDGNVVVGQGLTGYANLAFTPISRTALSSMRLSPPPSEYEPKPKGLHHLRIGITDAKRSGHLSTSRSHDVCWRPADNHRMMVQSLIDYGTITSTSIRVESRFTSSNDCQSFRQGIAKEQRADFRVGVELRAAVRGGK